MILIIWLIALELKEINFGNYQMPLKLFEDLRDGNVYPKEVLKNHVKFELDLNEIKVQ